MSTRAVAELEAAGVAFVEAIVVRCAPPTSARPGDRAIVFGDGRIEGFVGGACADATVRLQALRVLETGEPVLLRILPGEEDGPGGDEGAVVVANPCLSGGALELFLEPHLPAPRVAVAGDSPVARAVADLAGRVGFAARLGAVAEPGDFAAVAATLGHGDEEAVASALEAGVEYVALVASRRRGDGVLGELRASGVPEERLARVRTPAGLDIGARTHAEIALSIVAELVAARRAPAGPPLAPAAPAAPPLSAPADAPSIPEQSPPGALGDGDEGAAPAAPASPPGTDVEADAGPRAREAVDPVCGMTVAVGPDTPTAGGEAFCCEGCRDMWLRRQGAHAGPR